MVASFGTAILASFGCHLLFGSLVGTRSGKTTPEREPGEPGHATTNRTSSLRWSTEVVLALLFRARE